MLDTPVYLQIFNREQHTNCILNQLRKVKPKKLYIVADGPRRNHEKDLMNCEKTRKTLDRIDWNCEIKTKFFSENKGSYPAYVEGVSWLFKLEEQAILLEDDDFPHPEFFKFCDYFLKKYKNDTRIFSITGNNFWGRYSKNPFLSRFPSAWGWATWASTWNTLDFDFKSAELLKLPIYRKFLYNNFSEYYFYNNYFMSRKNQKMPPNWDFVLIYNCLIKGQLNIVPQLNLVKNIGFGDDATHTNFIDPFNLDIPAANYKLSLSDIDSIYYPNKDYDTYLNKITGPRGMRGLFRSFIQTVL
jgi:hypothetical protein